jgi:hypothetical protein
MQTAVESVPGPIMVPAGKVPPMDASPTGWTVLVLVLYFCLKK